MMIIIIIIIMVYLHSLEYKEWKAFICFYNFLWNIRRNIKHMKNFLSIHRYDPGLIFIFVTTQIALIPVLPFIL